MGGPALFELLSLAEGLQIMLMYTLVLVTGYYAKSSAEQAEASKKMAEEMMQQRYGAVLPIIDIQEQPESPEELAERAYGIGSGEFLKERVCILRSIGLGPAIGVLSFIRTPTGERRQWDFGTLAVREKTDKYPLSFNQRSGCDVVVAYYRDVYGQPFESGREVTVGKEKSVHYLGPLKIRKLTEEEYRILAREG